MGFHYSAYLAYGVEIPDTDENTLDRSIPDGTDVGHLRAGTYDHEMTFLVTKCAKADLGEWEAVNPERFSGDQYEAWDTQLAAAATAIGVTPELYPGWLLIPAMN